MAVEKQSDQDAANERCIINLIRNPKNFQFIVDYRGGNSVQVLCVPKMTKNNLEMGMKCIKYMLLCITAIFVVSF